MRVYVDESGDPGMAGRVGSTPHFTIAAVMFADEEAEASCRQAIRALKQELGWNSRQEFKFNKCRRDLSLRFFQAVSVQDFQYLAVTLNKSGLWGDGFRHKEPFQKYATRLLFTNAQPYLRDATVVMDQCGDRDFRTTMQSYLKRHIADAEGECPIVRVRTEKSHACELVQLADMVAGAIGRSYRKDKTDHKDYRAAIRSREIDVQFWPKFPQRPTGLVVKNDQPAA
ncbi:MAG TPA: DUF3800 domain-containing protein [Phycisphaerales bacterium]|nr:DUF3800 domain-containing protein [Phycisphaerales bacterium]